jgi:hypothetical protein
MTITPHRIMASNSIIAMVPPATPQPPGKRASNLNNNPANDHSSPKHVNPLVV